MRTGFNPWRRSWYTDIFLVVTKSTCFPFHSSTCTIPLHLQFKLCVYLRILFGHYWKNVPSVVTIYKHQQIIQALRQHHVYQIITG